MIDQIKKYFWPAIVGIGVIIGTYIGIDSLIEKRISDKLRDHEVIKEIASLVRPSCIFDYNGTIITDLGAAKFLKKKPDVKLDERAEPAEILISPTEHLNVQPLLECINYNCTVSAKRINKSDWLFTLTSQAHPIIAGTELEEWFFRLEIIR